jgi:hypothetical protein
MQESGAGEESRKAGSGTQAELAARLGEAAFSKSEEMPFSV